MLQEGTSATLSAPHRTGYEQATLVGISAHTGKYPLNNNSLSLRQWTRGAICRRCPLSATCDRLIMWNVSCQQVRIVGDNRVRNLAAIRSTYVVGILSINRRSPPQLIWKRVHRWRLPAVIGCASYPSVCIVHRIRLCTVSVDGRCRPQ